MKFDSRLAMLALPVVIAFGLIGLGRSSLAANPSAAQALKLTPIQEGVDYDRPTPEEAAKCKISAKKIDGHVGWVVESPEGTILRKFVDTNGDNVVDQWSYYKDGVEVYRDIDSELQRQGRSIPLVQHRPARAGASTRRNRTRRARIDRLESRFRRKRSRPRWWPPWPSATWTASAALLLTPEELQSLGLGKAKKRGRGGEDWRKAEGDFQALLARRTEHHAGDEMGAVRRHKPGHRAGGHRRSEQGPAGLRKRLGHRADRRQTQPGADRHAGAGGRRLAADRRPGHAGRRTGGGRRRRASSSSLRRQSPAARRRPAQRRIAEIARRTGEARSVRPAAAPTLLEQIAESGQDAGRTHHVVSPDWPTRSAPPCSRANRPTATSGWRPCFDKLQKSEARQDPGRLRAVPPIDGRYGLSHASPEGRLHQDSGRVAEDPGTVHCRLSRRPRTPPKPCSNWASPGSSPGRKTTPSSGTGGSCRTLPTRRRPRRRPGPPRRLDSVGKTIDSVRQGRRSGETVDLAKYRGKVVLIQYWATWCGPCKADMAALEGTVGQVRDSFTVLGSASTPTPRT